MSYLYTPPTFRYEEILEGSLRFGITTCTLVYRLGGQWYNLLTPGMDAPVVKNVDTDPVSGQFLYFDRPTSVADSLFTEMNANALTPSGYLSSWSPGTLVHQ